MANEVLDTAYFMTLAMYGQGKGQTIPTRATSTANTVDIIFRLHRQIVVNCVADGLHIDTTCSNIGCNQHANTAVLNFGQGARTLALIHITMQSHH